MQTTSSLTVAAFAMLLLAPPGPVHAGALSDVVTLEDVQTAGDTISGRLTNRAAVPIEDVELRVDYIFVWKDERDPGADDPSSGETIVVPDTIPPGGSVTFSQRKTVTLPDRSDGTFETTVAVTDVTKLVPQ